MVKGANGGNSTFDDMYATGGGGVGGDGNHPDTPTAGNGGSGIVIIRYPTGTVH